MEPLYTAACDEIDAAADVLNELSQDIWKNPELNFKEVHAHGVLTDFLETRGLSVERNYALDTGFRSVTGTGDDGPHVAILCEYDALPEIGHGCGHNLIAEVGIAAGLGVQAAFKANGKPLGKLTIMGTPAEEGGGGKVDMVNAKCFDGIDAVLMAHPAPIDAGLITWLAYNNVTVKYLGKAAHASAFPWDGVNALDAAVLCYQNVSCLRQQFKPDWRVSGVIKNGGAMAGIIPDITELDFYACAPTKEELEGIIQKLDNCFQSAASSTGCTVEICWGKKPYTDVIHNTTMIDLYLKHAKSVGVDFDAHGVAGNAGLPAASTDMGNVSYVVPSIQPVFYIGTNAANHTREFTEASGDPKAQPYTLAVGKALAMTAIDIFTQPDTLQKIKEEFAKKITMDDTHM